MGVLELVAALVAANVVVAVLDGRRSRDDQRARAIADLRHMDERLREIDPRFAIVEVEVHPGRRVGTLHARWQAPDGRVAVADLEIPRRRLGVLEAV